MENEIYTIKFQKEGYGEGFFDGQMRDRIKWQDKIKAKIEELKQKKYILSSRESEIEILQSLLEDNTEEIEKKFTLCNL